MSEYKINDILIYGSHGICRLLEIADRDFCGEKRNYYVLKPEHGSTSLFYVPTDSGALLKKLRPVKSADELRELVSVLSNSVIEWIEDDRTRQNILKGILETGETSAMMRAVKALYTEQKRLAAFGKKLRAIDDRLMRDISKLLFDEINTAFNISEGELYPAIFGEIELAERA